MLKYLLCLGICSSLLIFWGCGLYNSGPKEGFLVYAKSNPQEVFLESKDVSSYDAQRYLLHLTPEAAKKLASLEQPGIPKQVILQIDGRIIFEAYLGDIRLISCVASECYPGVFADISELGDHKLQLFYYPQMQSFHDPRDEPEFINYFKEL